VAGGKVRALVVLALLVGASAVALRLGRLGPAGRMGSEGPPPGGDAGPQRYGRIICMSPAVVELAFAVGAGNRVVGISQHTMSPPEALGLPVCGGFFNPNYERILSLHPDLILTQGRADDLKRFAGDNGIEMVSLDIGDLDSIITQTARLGELLQCEEGAARVCAETERRLDAVRARVAGKAPVKLLLVTAREPGSLNGIQAAGPGSFLDDLIAVAGGVNVVSDLPRSYGVVNKEALLARRPEVIVELHGEGGDAAALQREVRELWQGLSSLPAVRQGRVYAVEATYAMIPGPRVVQLAERLARLLHGEGPP